MPVTVTDFYALDLETANSDLASVCQIGLVLFKDMLPVERTSWKVNPEALFSRQNIAIHGITEQDVRYSPSFRLVYPELYAALKGKTVVHHMPFDRVVIRKSCERYLLPAIDCTWLNSAQIVRKAWPQFEKKGYGLASMAEFLKIRFKHHDALEDAETAGLIVCAAVKASGISLQKWVETFGVKEKNSFQGVTASFYGAGESELKKVSCLAQQAGFRVIPAETRTSELLVLVNETEIPPLWPEVTVVNYRQFLELLG